MSGIKIPFVFANTGIEFNVIKEFVNDYDYDNKVIVKPRKPFGQILKEYGKPAISKNKSESLRTYQNNNDPMRLYRIRTLIIGEQIRDGEGTGERSKFGLAEKHFHFLHENLGYKVANKCCTYMKKLPFKDFEKANNMKGSFSGVRTAEGGIRATAYKKPIEIKGGFIKAMPILDWTDEMVEQFIKDYNVKLSRAYTEYGLNRTGCVGCPFSQNLEKELKATYDNEPLMYKAVMKWLGDVYIDQEIKLEFDHDYMERYEIRNKRNLELRTEMLNKYGHLRLSKRKTGQQLQIEFKGDKEQC